MPGKRWVQREKESLIRQVKQGKRLPQIRISGRSPAAVNQQRQGLRNAGPLGEVPKRRLRLWTTKEIRSLRGYVNRFRLSAAQIARAGLLAGRGKDSISQQMRRQGLGDPKRQEASRSAHRLDANPHFQFDFGIPTLQRPSASLFIGVQALSGRTEANTQWVKKKTSRFSSPSTDF